jgi:hypothetical protein
MLTHCATLWLSPLNPEQIAMLWPVILLYHPTISCVKLLPLLLNIALVCCLDRRASKPHFCSRCPNERCFIIPQRAASGHSPRQALLLFPSPVLALKPEKPNLQAWLLHHYSTHSRPPYLTISRPSLAVRCSLLW